MRAARIRFSLDDRSEKMGLKIREAQTQKVPYVLVVGDREAAEGTVAVRNRQGQSTTMALAAFVGELQEEIASRRQA